MSLLIETLERIASFLESGHPIMVEISRSLQPGLSLEEITSQLEGFPYSLPTEVIELYQWRNGQHRDCLREFVPFYRFLSLKDTLKEYKSQIELAMEFAEEDLPWQKLYDPCWLPVFQEDGNHYVIPTSLEHRETSAVLTKSEYSSGDEVWKSELFPNLTNMMLAVAECWETGACYIAKNIYGEDYLRTSLIKESEIYLKYQPKRKKSVELLLDSRKLELSKEELVRAYYDLVNINHSRAEEILKRDAQEYAATDHDLSDSLIRHLQELKRRQESGWD